MNSKKVIPNLEIIEAGPHESKCIYSKGLLVLQVVKVKGVDELWRCNMSRKEMELKREMKLGVYI